MTRIRIWCRSCHQPQVKLTSQPERYTGECVYCGHRLATDRCRYELVDE